AHEALAELLDGTMPDDPPAEGAIQHLQDFMAAVQEAKEAGVLDPQVNPGTIGLVQAYMKRLIPQAQAEMQQMRLQQMGQQMGQIEANQAQAGPPQPIGPATNAPI